MGGGWVGGYGRVRTHEGDGEVGELGGRRFRGEGQCTAPEREAEVVRRRPLAHDRAMVFGIITGLLRRRGSHTPAGNFSSKRGNKNYYKGKGGRKYGRIDSHGAPAAALVTPKARALRSHAAPIRWQASSCCAERRRGSCLTSASFGYARPSPHRPARTRFCAGSRVAAPARRSWDPTSPTATACRGT